MQFIFRNIFAAAIMGAPGAAFAQATADISDITPKNHAQERCDPRPSGGRLRRDRESQASGRDQLEVVYGRRR